MSSSIGKILRSSSICQNNDVIFYFQKTVIIFFFPKKMGCLPFFKIFSIVQVMLFSAISLLVRMLDIAKLKLSSASLIERGLGLSLATTNEQYQGLG
jgi:hypothetical protein